MHRAFQSPQTKAFYNGFYGGKIFEVTLMEKDGPPLLIAN
jgi:hypothetical protein